MITHSQHQCRDRPDTGAEAFYTPVPSIFSALPCFFLLTEPASRLTLRLSTIEAVLSNTYLYTYQKENSYGNRTVETRNQRPDQPQPDREQLCRSGADDPKPLLGQAGGCAGAEESIRDREGKAVPEGRSEHSPGF